MVLSGLTNKRLVAELTAAGLPAIGLSGRDGRMIRARLEPGLGRVGRPDTIDVRPLHSLWREGWVPGRLARSAPAPRTRRSTLTRTRRPWHSPMRCRREASCTSQTSMACGSTRASSPKWTLPWRARRSPGGPLGEGMRLKVDMALAGGRQRNRRSRRRRRGPPPRGLRRNADRFEDGSVSADPFLGIYRRDTTLVGGKGVRLVDSEGRSYLDFAAGIGVNGLGYGDRKVVAAIPCPGRQADPREQPVPQRAGNGAGRAAGFARLPRSRVFLQLRSRGDRGGNQARTQARTRAGPRRARRFRWRIPRPHVRRSLGLQPLSGTGSRSSRWFRA